MEMMLLLLILGFIVAFAIGSNDEAMSPAVGARILTVNTAVVLGALATSIGAALIGGVVSETVGSDLVGGRDMTPGMVLAILAAMSIWLFVVSASKGLPISTTQCVVGSVLGVVIFGPLAGETDWGPEAIDWLVIGRIAAGWVLSPVIGFLISSLVVMAMRRTQKKARGLVSYEKQERLAARGLLVFLLLTCFSRGGNDVANAIAPLFALADFRGSFMLGTLLLDAWVIPLIVGAVGMAFGLVLVGRRVVRTLATGIVTLSPSTALAASVSVSLVLFVGTILGLPLSGTHVLVASLIAVGWVERTSARTQQVRDIIISWLITVPLSALLAFGVLVLINAAT